jgi:hypothetical protein
MPGSGPWSPRLSGSGSEVHVGEVPPAWGRWMSVRVVRRAAHETKAEVEHLVGSLCEDSVRSTHGPAPTIGGTLAADGSVTAALMPGPSGPGHAETRHPLPAPGAAACPWRSSRRA